jgi:osmotically inducible protein OsmC
MTNRTATANWQGDLQNGNGTIAFGNGRFEESFSADSRFGDGNQTNPEELIAGAHAGCYSMALSHALSEAGYTVEKVDTKANVQLEESGDSFAVTTITLQTEATVPGLKENEFQKIAKDAKENCPVSKALAGCDIRLEARLQFETK